MFNVGVLVVLRSLNSTNKPVGPALHKWALQLISPSPLGMFQFSLITQEFKISLSH